MIIEKVDLRGFGSLRDRVFNFSSAINIIIGPNEAGKSTLLQAIQALLYGQFRDSAEWAGDAARTRFRPWSGADYGGTIHVRLASGVQYRIVRRFENEPTAVFREPGATDVTATYGPGPYGWVEFSDQHLGLTPSVFRASVCINQDDLSLDRDDVQALHSRLKTLADSGGAEQSAQAAMSLLDIWLKARVNPDAEVVAHSPLRRAAAAVSDLQDQLKRSYNALDDLANLVADGMRWSEVEARSQEQFRKLQGFIAWLEAEDLDLKLRRHVDIERRMAASRTELERVADASTLTEQGLDDANRSLVEANRLRDDVERLTAQTRREAESRGQFERKVTEIADELNRLSPATQAPPEALLEAQSAVERWDLTTNQFGEATDLLAAVRRRRMEEESRLDPRLKRIPHSSVDDLRLALSNAVTRQDDLDLATRRFDQHPSESVLREEQQTLQTRLGLLIDDDLTRMRALSTDMKSVEQASPKETPAKASWLGTLIGRITGRNREDGAIGVLGTANSRRAPASPRTSQLLLDRWLAEYGARSVDELQQAWDRRAQVQVQIGEARSIRDNFEAAGRDCSTAFDDLDRLAGTRKIDAAREILDLAVVWESRRSDLDREESDAREAMNAARRLMSEAQSSARTVLGGLGITSSDPILALASLKKLRVDRERRAAMLQQRAEVQADLDRHLKTTQALDERRPQLDAAESLARDRLAAVGVTRGYQDWTTDLARRRELYQTYRDATLALEAQEQIQRALVGSDDPSEWWAKLAEWRQQAVRPDDGDVRTLDTLQTEAQKLREQLAEARSRLATIETRRDERLSSLTEPAEIVERLAHATAVQAQLENLSNVVQKSRSLIQAVAEEYRRNFAPRLGDRVSIWLDHATSHRYTRAEVSPADLSVKLESHERGGLVTLDQVSHGTRDTVGLLFRASVVDILSNPTEPVPLFLDDPLVYVDPERTQSVIDTLFDLAQTRQIFYFTQDPRIVDWVKQRGECFVHTLARVSR